MPNDDTKYFIDKLPTITTRVLPDNWDPINESKMLKANIRIWGRITSKICQSLWAARSILARPGKRTDLNINGEAITFESFCTLSGVHPRTARRWLERYDPLTETLTEPKTPAKKLLPEPPPDDTTSNHKNESATIGEQFGELISDVPYTSEDQSTYIESLSIALSELRIYPDITSETATKAITILNKIIRKTNRIKIDITNKFKDATTPLEKDLFPAAKESFTSKNSFPINYKIETPKLWDLVSLCLKAEDPPKFLLNFVATAWELCNGDDKFWKDKPFLPSSFVTPKMIPIMLKKIDNMKPITDPETLSDAVGIFKS